MSPVVVTAVFAPRSEHRGNVSSAIHAALPEVRAESGCLLYALHEADDDTFVLIEKWSSRAQLEAHGNGPAVAALNRALDGLLEKPPQVVIMDPIGSEHELGKGAI